ncbi:hypothetical protein PMZ80_005235 [Knufia obscura]|uniref:Uncharacterized protein n=2 Tax=Knufia TaxID=430999 RepID=A0AAN8I795_9EURO|nr:hypothetical protein PMZ80_005235 [Knufia obscura]KAK5957902.1 hypothetical protein OHC33_001091 [Knufia fluminis]
MNSLAPLPAASTVSSRFYKLCATVLNTTTKRHQSSYRRARSRLNVKPDPNFLPSKTIPHDHIIHNPPPSMPNVFHTPAIFLPKDDKRNLIQTPQTKSLLAGTSAFTPSGKERLPPPVRKPYEKRYHLTEADFDEMRKLRGADPLTWSVKKLSKKFDCSGILVSMATEGLAKNKQAMQKAVTDVIKSRWGAKRTVAREDRQLRREQWYKDT